LFLVFLLGEGILLILVFRLGKGFLLFLVFRLGEGILTTSFFYSGSGILLILSLLILPEGIKGGFVFLIDSLYVLVFIWGYCTWAFPFYMDLVCFLDSLLICSCFYLGLLYVRESLLYGFGLFFRLIPFLFLFLVGGIVRAEIPFV
jgi:hypothetical protein